MLGPCTCVRGLYLYRVLGACICIAAQSVCYLYHLYTVLRVVGIQSIQFELRNLACSVALCFARKILSVKLLLTLSCATF